MGNEGSKSRRPCKNYQWDKSSAWRKAKSDVSVSVNAGPVSVSKQVSKPNNDKKDAYRNCKNCGKHKNYHKKEKLPGK